MAVDGGAERVADAGPAPLFAALQATSADAVRERLARFAGGAGGAKPAVEQRARDVGAWPGTYVSIVDEPTAEDDDDYLEGGDWGFGEEEERATDGGLATKQLAAWDLRLGRCAGQVLRYQRGGAPLLPAPCEVNPGACAHCGSGRVFELEVLSTAILHLDDISPMQFLALVVYTCGNDGCAPPCAEEFVYVARE